MNGKTVAFLFPSRIVTLGDEIIQVKPMLYFVGGDDTRHLEGHDFGSILRQAFAEVEAELGLDNQQLMLIRVSDKGYAFLVPFGEFVPFGE
ncbi:MAG TPA: hypothetical protein VLT90_13035 [Terriglobales bacterium]|nr:hypothetical protein [Terriglobales bacterium]